MPKFTEKTLIEDYLIEKLVAAGWRNVPAGELARESFDEPLIIPDLTRSIETLNASCGIGEEEVKQTINELKMRLPGQEGIKQVLDFLKYGVPVKFEKERVVNYVKLFDYENISANDFVVSRQVNYQSGDKLIRADTVLYVNGIPLVVIECKDPTSFSADWLDAYKQIKRYEKEVPELFKYAQIGVAVESVAKYFPIVPWQDDTRVYEWRDGDKNSADAVMEMLAPQVLLDIIRNFLFSRIEYGSAAKVIARYMQYRAANKISERVLNNLDGKEDKSKGLIWHWQGSGKTLTMIFAAHKLRTEKRLENPSLFFIVDRLELEEQLKNELSALGMSVHLIDSRDELKKVIRSDDYMGRRDLMLALIHKFSPEELADLRVELKKKRSAGTIQTRKNVIAFIDEGHRSQYGNMAGQMNDILESAFKFAFTGTPISKEGRDTYEDFSYPPEERYLDKYFIADSIKDGFTVKVVYQPRLEKDIHLNKEELEAFIESEFEEIPSVTREIVKEDVKKRLDNIRVHLENPSRIAKIAADIKEHFSQNVDGKFKAMVVAVSRRACVLYKRELDKHFPPDYSEIVMTSCADDEKLISDYFDDLKKRNKGKDMDDIKKETVENFKDEEKPKILIVTDMLLTGFDAPVLQTLYLDKPLKEHRLLQAIARTNRPYKNLKEAGMIIDYAGILKEFRKAFEMYSKEEVKEALSDMKELKGEFALLVEETVGLFGGLKLSYDRRTLLKAIEILTADESAARRFREDYKKLRRLFELLGSDTVKLDYFEEYKWLSGVYTYYIREALKEPGDADVYFERYFSKTIQHIYRTTEIEDLVKNLPQVAYDENYFDRLNERVKSKEEKAANIVFTLNKLVLVDRQKAVIYMSIADKVERILDEWRKKNKNYDKIYADGTNVLREIDRLKDRQQKLGFSDLEYSILLTLEKHIGPKKELVGDAKEISGILSKEMFDGWVLQPSAKKNIERELRAFLRKYIVRYGIAYEKMDKIFNIISDNVAKYETLN